MMVLVIRILLVLRMGIWEGIAKPIQIELEQIYHGRLSSAGNLIYALFLPNGFSDTLYISAYSLTNDQDAKIIMTIKANNDTFCSEQ